MHTSIFFAGIWLDLETCLLLEHHSADSVNIHRIADVRTNPSICMCWPCNSSVLSFDAAPLWLWREKEKKNAPVNCAAYTRSHRLHAVTHTHSVLGDSDLNLIAANFFCVFLLFSISCYYEWYPKNSWRGNQMCWIFCSCPVVSFVPLRSGHFALILHSISSNIFGIKLRMRINLVRNNNTYLRVEFSVGPKER